MKFQKKQLIGPLVFTALIVLLDQITKALVVAGIPFGGQVPAIPGLFHLTYVRNAGAAFSMLKGMRWLFLILVAAFFITLVLMIKKGLVDRPYQLWCLAAIGGGALGNAIDRAVSGTVVDMIEVEFVRFAVFNVADSFITCGAIVLVVWLLFFDRKEPGHATEG